jgi:hypothetical protein
VTEFGTLANRVADSIEYKDDYWVLCRRDQKDPTGRLYYQVTCWRRDTDTNVWAYGYGRKAYLSVFMTYSELVRLAFGLLLAYEEHECREAFRVDGVRVFGPHISVEALKTVADQVDVRPLLVDPDRRDVEFI